MPKTVHGIDLTAPGGIEALLAFHYQNFGDAVMLADGEEDEDNDSDEDEDGEDQDNSGSEDESDEDEEEVDGTDALGDKGQKALRAMKDRVKASKKAEREAKAELERLKNSAGKSEEQLAEQPHRQLTAQPPGTSSATSRRPWRRPRFLLPSACWSSTRSSPRCWTRTTPS